MQNVNTQTRPFPSWAAIAAALLTTIAAAVLVLYLSTQLGHQTVSSSSAPVVTKSVGSELVQQNTSDRNAASAPVVTKSVGSELVQQNTSERNAASEQPSDPGVLRPHGPR